MDQHREHAARPAGRSPVAGPSETVRHDVWVWLAPTGTRRIAVRAHFDYDRADPCAVRVSFCLPHQRQVTWIFARDLLADGLYFPVGAGDIRIAPDGGPAGNNTRITLTPPSGAAVIQVRRASVRDFLRATERLVPRGQEEIDIDAFLKDCVEEG
ncbi:MULTISPECIES: SsgA family sporulation/cell division regulator [Streptomyces]|uniref:Sporulation-specific cell division protein SsgB n=1 Tax=Streptomyces canarius TaxID=285453 RepID=A0ABQ3DBX8_9ACTN|nr:SsgA family sporulation/cell division regulator [Streptomyces canarius]GHA77744.1 sporulation-specific cell division protein SsgB [Streptomyces canarius]